jgi:hypothetical protein
LKEVAGQKYWFGIIAICYLSEFGRSGRSPGSGNSPGPGRLSQNKKKPIDTNMQLRFMYN